jgi:hypothetical protein
MTTTGPVDRQTFLRLGAAASGLAVAGRARTSALDEPTAQAAMSYPPAGHDRAADRLNSASADSLR